MYMLQVLGFGSLQSSVADVRVLGVLSGWQWCSRFWLML